MSLPELLALPGSRYVTMLRAARLVELGLLADLAMILRAATRYSDEGFERFLRGLGADADG